MDFNHNTQIRYTWSAHISIKSHTENKFRLLVKVRQEEGEPSACWLCKCGVSACTGTCISGFPGGNIFLTGCWWQCSFFSVFKTWMFLLSQWGFSSLVSNNWGTVITVSCPCCKHGWRQVCCQHEMGFHWSLLPPTRDLAGENTVKEPVCGKVPWWWGWAE